MASSDAIVLALPQNGAACYAFAIPNDLLLVNLPLYHQCLQLGVGGAGQLLSVSSSNGLQVVLGVLYAKHPPARTSAGAARDRAPPPG